MVAAATMLYSSSQSRRMHHTQPRCHALSSKQPQLHQCSARARCNTTRALHARSCLHGHVVSTSTSPAQAPPTVALAPAAVAAAENVPKWRCSAVPEQQQRSEAFSSQQQQQQQQPGSSSPSGASTDSSGSGSGSGISTEYTPPLQVTRHNFHFALPVLRDALASCQFYSFDCEMSGLYPPGLEDYPSDDVDDR